MILEEGTFEEFGYYPSDLSPKSNKKILAACDDCGKAREVQKDGYRDLCRSCARKEYYRAHPEARERVRDAVKGEKNPMYGRRGEKNPLFGKHTSEETRQKIRKALKGKHPSDETRKKIREARKHQIFPKYHTKPEKIWQEIAIDKHLLPFKYTGDGSFWIGEDPSLNPDFVHLTKKIAVEVYGDYWHSPLLRPDMKEIQNPIYRKRILKKHGWKLIAFWESDLKRKDAEAFVVNVLRKEGVIK